MNSDSSVRDGSESLHEIDSRREVTFVEGQGDNGVDPPSSRGSLIVGSSESVQVPSSAISSALIAGASIAGDSGPSVVSGGTPAGSGDALMAVNSGVGSGELIQQLTQLV